MNWKAPQNRRGKLGRNLENHARSTDDPEPRGTGISAANGKQDELKERRTIKQLQLITVKLIELHHPLATSHL